MTDICFVVTATPTDCCTGSFAEIKSVVDGLGWDALIYSNVHDFVNLAKKKPKRLLLRAFWEKIIVPNIRFLPPVPPVRLTRQSQYLYQLQEKPVLNFARTFSNSFHISNLTSATTTDESFQHALLYPNYMGLLLQHNNINLTDLQVVVELLTRRQSLQTVPLVFLDLSANQVHPGYTEWRQGEQRSSMDILQALAQWATFIDICDNPLAEYAGRADLGVLPLATLAHLIWIPSSALAAGIWKSLLAHTPDQEERIAVVEATHRHYYGEQLGDYSDNELRRPDMDNAW